MPMLGGIMLARFLQAGLDDAVRGDDRADRPHDVACPSRPAIFGRTTVRLFALLGMAAIVYGSLAPFDIAPGKTLNWWLGWHPLVIGDAVTNVLIYLPMGLLARLAYRRRGSHWLGEIVFALCVVVTLSYLSEVYQTILARRVACWADVVFNAAGGGLGALLAPLLQRMLRNQHAWLYRELRTQPFHAAAFAVLVALACYALLPLDIRPTRAHVERAWSQLTATSWSVPWVSASDPARPLAPLRVYDKLATASAYGFLAFLLVLAAQENSVRMIFPGTLLPGHAPKNHPDTLFSVWYGLTRAMWVVFAIEALQFLTISHVADVRELLVGWACCGIGAAVALCVLARRGGLLPRPRIVVRGFLLVMAALVAGRTLVVAEKGVRMIFMGISMQGYAEKNHPDTIFGSVWAPMVAVFHRPWEALLADYTASGLQYAALAVVTVLGLRAYHRRPAWFWIVGVPWVAAVVTQTWAAWCERPADTAHLLLALLAGWAVLRADRAVFPATWQPRRLLLG